MQNHGVLAVGRTLGDAVTVAATVEYVAAVYARARSLGTPIILPDEEITRLRTRFAAYRPERLL
jgi:ribulose-5-phosphate 4-epimerase/fuculose-1-phosphate aldolase